MRAAGRPLLLTRKDLRVLACTGFACSVTLRMLGHGSSMADLLLHSAGHPLCHVYAEPPQASR